MITDKQLMAIHFRLSWYSVGLVAYWNQLSWSREKKVAVKHTLMMIQTFVEHEILRRKEGACHD